MPNKRVLTCVVSLALVLTGRALPAQLSTPASRPVAGAPSPASQEDAAAVTHVIERFRAAMIAGDTATIMGLLDADAVILESGSIETRAEYQAHHLASDIGHAKATKSTRGPLRVTVLGDVAWAASTSTTTGETRGRPVNSAGAELMVLTRTPAGWRIAAIHWSSRSLRPPG